MYTEHTLLFITVAMVQCKAVFIKLLTTVNNLLTVVNIGRSMVKWFGPYILLLSLYSKVTFHDHEEVTLVKSYLVKGDPCCNESFVLHCNVQL